MREPWCGRPNYIQIYIPSRTAIVLRPLIVERQIIVEADEGVLAQEAEKQGAVADIEAEIENKLKIDAQNTVDDRETIVLLSSDS